MQWQWLVAPLVGSVIGYITNDIAVRMLFRPHREIRLFGRKLPFTPGLIPKERGRLAAAIRSVLDQELLSPQVLEEALLSPGIVSRVDAALSQALESFFAQEKTPRELLEQFTQPEAVAQTESRILAQVNSYLMDKLLSSGLEQIVAEAVISEVRRKLSSSAGGFLSIFFDEKRSSSLQEKLSSAVREQIVQRGPELLASLLSDVAHQGLDTPLCELSSGLQPRKDEIKSAVLSRYADLIRALLPRALQMLDLGAVVEDRLNALDVAQLEELILRVMKKELHAIVWLGALLGAVMGLTNLLFL